jgi:hypothetical protein
MNDILAFPSSLRRPANALVAVNRVTARMLPHSFTHLTHQFVHLDPPAIERQVGAHLRPVLGHRGIVDLVIEVELLTLRDDMRQVRNDFRLSRTSGLSVLRSGAPETSGGVRPDAGAARAADSPAASTIFLVIDLQKKTTDPRNVSGHRDSEGQVWPGGGTPVTR